MVNINKKLKIGKKTKNYNVFEDNDKVDEYLDISYNIRCIGLMFYGYNPAVKFPARLSLKLISQDTLKVLHRNYCCNQNLRLKSRHGQKFFQVRWEYTEEKYSLGM